MKVCDLVGLVATNTISIHIYQRGLDHRDRFRGLIFWILLEVAFVTVGVEFFVEWIGFAQTVW